MFPHDRGAENDRFATKVPLESRGISRDGDVDLNS